MTARDEECFIYLTIVTLLHVDFNFIIFELRRTSQFPFCPSSNLPFQVYLLK